jgi:hypothetical protein
MYHGNVLACMVRSSALLDSAGYGLNSGGIWVWVVQDG